MKLHLGVRVEPYLYGSRGRTTGEVADILESKYGILRLFYEDHRDRIHGLLMAGAEKALGDVLAGRKPQVDVKQAALETIRQDFRKWILARSLDGRVRGVPTKASLMGVSHGKTYPMGVPTRSSAKAKAEDPAKRLTYKARHPARPSFYDTGLYVSAFKAWVE